MKSNTFYVAMFVYYYYGNIMQPSVIMTAHRGTCYFNNNMNRINRLFKNSYSITESMTRLNKLYNAAETQKGLVNRSEDPDEDIAIKMQGCFSYGVVPVKDKAEKDEEIEKLKKKDKEEKEKLDKQRWKIAKMLDKVKFEKEKEYEL